MTGEAQTDGEQPAHAGTTNRIGIAFSGGGIRSASFCLGVYQRLLHDGIFRRAKYLAAVSGGAYLAAGLAIAYAKNSEEALSGEDIPWSRRSAEESHLSSHLNYLARGEQGRLWLGANLAYGLVMNLLPLVCAAILIGKVLGLAYRQLYAGIGNPKQPIVWLSFHSGYTYAVSLTALLLGVALLLVLGRRFEWQRPARVRGLRRSFQWPSGLRRGSGRTEFENGGILRRDESIHPEVGSTIIAAALVAWFGVLLPLLISVVSGRTSWLGVRSEQTTVRWAEQRTLAAIAAILLSVALGGLAVSCLAHHVFPRVRSVLAAVAGPSILLVPLVWSAQAEAVWGWRGTRDVLWVSALAFVLVLGAICAPNRRYSLHPYYRESLQSAFCLVRDSSGKTAPIPYDEEILLSDIEDTLSERRARGMVQFPELVVCAAVAASGGSTPYKSRALSITFDRWGSCIHGVRKARAKAAEQDIDLPEAAATPSASERLTLPSMMAASGAALSPLMGRFTLPAFRFLMAILNVRLGIWVRNTSKNRNSSLMMFEKLDTWADSQALQVSGWRRLAAKAWKGWREPGALFVLREGLGLADVSDRYLYISDGGHWENLGLVELLRRNCTHVFCVDASGGTGLGDLARAAAIARRDLACEVSIEYDGLRCGDDGMVTDPIASGTITYEDGTQGQIIVARCALWPTAPEDLQARARHAGAFPSDPTSKQFFSGEEFEAYRALGWFVGARLAAAAKLPYEVYDETRTRGSETPPDSPVLTH